LKDEIIKKISTKNLQKKKNNKKNDDEIREKNNQGG
jgi:hypothetical protein